MLIIDHNDGMGGTLFLTGSTFSTFLKIDRFWLLTHPLIDFARTNLNTVTASVARLLVELRMHQIPLPRKVK